MSGELIERLRANAEDYTGDLQCEAADEIERLRAELSALRGEGWQSIESAPRDGTEFQARIPGDGEDNVIAWVGDLLDSRGEYCGAWAFTRDQEPPDDWTDGYCWEVNEDGNRSTEPTHWKPLPTPDADVIARLVGALEDIAHWTPRPFEMPADWSEQINACADCQRYSGHPIQRGICDTHRRPLWDREKHAKHQDVLRGLDAQQIASAALTDTAAQRQSVSPQGDGGLAQ